MPLTGSVVAMPGGGAYGLAMAATMLRLLTLLALVLMPLGMTAAPALAEPAPKAHAGMAGAGHCDDMPSKEQAPPSSKMDCTAMCTALPAGFGPAADPAMTPVAPRSIAASAPFSGIEPEIATPPPRRG